MRKSRSARTVRERQTEVLLSCDIYKVPLRAHWIQNLPSALWAESASWRKNGDSGAGTKEIPHVGHAGIDAGMPFSIHDGAEANGNQNERGGPCTFTGYVRQKV